MREIKFRGKALRDTDLRKAGEWIYSDSVWQGSTGTLLLCYTDTNGFWLDVDPATVGQFTGLLDKNGKEIYEGDIFGGCPWDGLYVAYCDKCKSFEPHCCYEGTCYACQGDMHWAELATPSYPIEIIGNIHDNPELLEAK